MKKKMYAQIKVYLKDMRKPVKLIFDSTKSATEFLDKIESATHVDVIKYGGFMFAKSEFKCAMFEIKKSFKIF